MSSTLSDAPGLKPQNPALSEQGGGRAVLRDNSFGLISMG